MVKRAPERRDIDPLLAMIRSRVPGLQGIWLFGSLARGRARPDSDIDLAVLAKAPIDPVAVFDLGLELGVIASRDVDLVDLRAVSILLRHVVMKDGTLVDPIDPAACTTFAADTAALNGALREEQRIASRLGARSGS